MVTSLLLVIPFSNDHDIHNQSIIYLCCVGILDVGRLCVFVKLEHKSNQRTITALMVWDTLVEP